ncbi:MAG TPA: histidine kinase [Pyrinomonadaceae bacterium]|jgi:signal transduction histidine kinase
MTARRWLSWLSIFGCFTLVGLMFAGQWYVGYTANGYPVTWLQVSTWALTEWWLWALLSPCILWCAARFYIDRQNRRRTIPIHVALGLGFSFIHIILHAAAEQWTTWAWAPDEQMSFTSSLYHLSTKKFHINLLTYFVIVGVSHAVEYYRRYQERATLAAQLEAQLSRAQLHALKMQLHPHFLFNTLNTISALIHRDPRAADRMVARLGDLLRLTLDNHGVEEVPLKEELEFLEKYLEIEQTRFHDRLSVRMEIDPESLDARLPNLLLQPLVENAIRHGISARPGAGHIEIYARRSDGVLLLAVRDDGTGLPADWQTCGQIGVGLTNTRARLAQHYGASHSFTLANVPGGGLEVAIVIPFRPALGGALSEANARAADAMNAEATDASLPAYLPLER